MTILKAKELQRHTLPVMLILGCIAVATPALAYVGPGAGLTAIGTVLSLVAAVFMAIVGFIWYPIKRLLRRTARPRQEAVASVEPEE